MISHGQVFVKGNLLPRALASFLKTDHPELEELSSILEEKFSFLEFPIEFLPSIEEVKTVSEDDLWFQESLWNVAKPGKAAELPVLDFQKSVIIGINKYPGEDLAIALDYRQDPDLPAVVASNFRSSATNCNWEVIASSFEDLLALMNR